jgi:hypothetical protein
MHQKRGITSVRDSHAKNDLVLSCYRTNGQGAELITRKEVRGLAGLELLYARDSPTDGLSS